MALRRLFRRLTPTWWKAKRLSAQYQWSGGSPINLTPGQAYTLIRARQRSGG